MEWHHAKLKGQSTHHKDQAQHQNLVVDVARGHRLEYGADIQRARGAIQQRHTVEQEATA